MLPDSIANAFACLLGGNALAVTIVGNSVFVYLDPETCTYVFCLSKRIEKRINYLFIQALHFGY